MNVDGGRNDFVHARDELYSGRETVLAVHVYRLFSTFLGALGLLGVYLTGLVVLPSKRHIGAMLFMGSVAFIPMYIFSSSVISNDILVGALGIWCIYFCLRSVLGKTNLIYFAAATICVLAAFFTKYTVITLLPAYGITILALLIRSWRGGWRRFRKISVVLFGTVVVQLAIVYFWTLNQRASQAPLEQRYSGLDDPLMARILKPYEGGIAEVLTRFWDALKFTFLAYWGLLGVDSIPLQSWLLQILAFVTILIVFGVLYQFFRGTLSRRTKILIGLSTLVAITTVYGIYTLIIYGVRGRYILSLYSVFAFLLIIGSSAYRTKRHEWQGSWILVILLFLISLAAPVFVIRPALTPPKTELAVDLRANETPVFATFGDIGELLAIAVEPQSVGPYEAIAVTLVWRVLNATTNNYVVGVHLSGVDNTYFGGSNHFPGNGNYATSLWRPGEVFRDKYRFYVEAAKNTTLPTAGKIGVSVFCPTIQGEQYLPVTNQSKEYLGDTVYSLPIRIGTSKTISTLPAKLIADFSEEVGLVKIEGVPVHLDGLTESTLQYDFVALSDLSSDYSVYLQLLNDDNSVVYGVDLPVTNNYYPSSLWLKGERVEHRHDIDLSIIHLLPSGHYRLVTGIYDVESGERLPLMQGYDRGIPEGYLLGDWDWENYPIFMPIIMIPGETQGTEWNGRRQRKRRESEILSYP